MWTGAWLWKDMVPALSRAKEHVLLARAVLGFKGKGIKRKRRHFPANKSVHPESLTSEG